MALLYGKYKNLSESQGHRPFRRFDPPAAIQNLDLIFQQKLTVTHEKHWTRRVFSEFLGHGDLPDSKLHPECHFHQGPGPCRADCGGLPGSSGRPEARQQSQAFPVRRRLLDLFRLLHPMCFVSGHPEESDAVDRFDDWGPCHRRHVRQTPGRYKLKCCPLPPSADNLHRNRPDISVLWSGAIGFFPPLILIPEKRPLVIPPRAPIESSSPMV